MEGALFMQQGGSTMESAMAADLCVYLVAIFIAAGIGLALMVLAYKK